MNDLPFLLRERFGFSEFRPAQKQVIDCVMAGENVLAVMPTGSGKSLCYQLPALALPGLTLVISPLIALMKDQVDHLSRLGIPATLINSTVHRDSQRIRLQRAVQGHTKILYIAPERFQSDEFLSTLNHARISLLAVDEAHCISLWGHDFRPDYLRLKSLIGQIGKPPVLALTATATPSVRNDIVQQLGLAKSRLVVSGFDRPNLYLDVRETASFSEKLRAVVELARNEAIGIVYAGTRNNVEQLQSNLRRAGVSAVSYHAGLPAAQRKSVQEQFMTADRCVIVATNAFGMGIDRREVRFVTHVDIPGSLEAYYQEIGRAGRDGLPARCLLLFNYSDKRIPEFFIDSNYPPPDILKYLFKKISQSTDLTVTGDAWARISGNSDARFNAAIALLQKAGYLERIQNREGRGVRILKPEDRELSGFDFGDIASRREFERRKLDVMLAYASRFRRHCYRTFILKYFGEWHSERNCGACGRCTPELLFNRRA